MPLNLLHRLRAQFRSQRPLRPLQIFQLVLIYILALLIVIRALAQLIISKFTQPDFFALLTILAMLLCAREVYKGAEGGKWHFHGICTATLFFVLLHSWFYGYYHREPLTHAILAGLMLEFMAYMLLNKIFAALEARRYAKMFSSKMEEGENK